jgi:hypothetical protein
MAEKLTACDPAEGLASGETIAAFMEEAFRTDDAPYIAHTLGVMARAQGMTQIANETCLRANHHRGRQCAWHGPDHDVSGRSQALGRGVTRNTSYWRGLVGWGP